MTKQEAAIITAYTGIMIGKFSDFHKYAEELLERPVLSHEFASKDTMDSIKNLSRKDFISMEVV